MNFRVNAPAGLTIAGVYIPHMWSLGINDNGSGWAGDFFWAGGSGGVRVFDQETGWSSATPAPLSSHGPRRHALLRLASRVLFKPCTDGGDEWLSVELLELNMAETTGPPSERTAGLWAHGKHLDPRQLAVGLHRRLALRRLQPQRFAERHQHPGIQLGAEPLGVSPVRCANRATDDQHRPIRQRRPAAQTRAPAMPPACTPAPDRPTTSTTSPSASA